MTLLLCTMMLAAPEPTWSVATQKLPAPDSVAKEIREELDPQALVLSEKGNTSRITFWFRKEIPALATAEQIKNGLTCREIPEGTLVGVVKFDSNFVDFRKQEIPAGVYTLRFAMQPDVGDHKGTAPHPEFLVLSPVGKDRSPDAVEVKNLLPLSREATGGDHPGVMLLFPDHAKGERPALSEKKGVRILLVKRAVRAGATSTTLSFGVTVAGWSDSR